MKLTSNLQDNLHQLHAILPIGKSFDILEKVLYIHGRTFYLYFIDGFAKDTNIEYIRRDIFALPQETIDKIHTAEDLIRHGISSIEVSTETDINELVKALLAGQTILLFDGSSSAAVIDLRTYPTRGINEPEKEKTIRGARDGFVETIVFNTSLIRRRIRDPHLIFEMMNIGKISNTDVAIGYLSNKVDKKVLKKVKDMLSHLQINSLTMGDQTLIESVNNETWFNPFPKARYTERPDVAAAQVAEGKIVILVDNSPTAIIVPTGIFDFLQDVDDYYVPILTGNYLRFVRHIIFLVNLFLTPAYVLIVQHESMIPSSLSFLLPDDPLNVPLFIQFLALEIAVDGLKIASLNTPSSLGTSLSVIGGLILGEYAVKTGWLVPHSIFYMSIVALSSFTQPSIELSYGIKFMRILMLLGAGLFGTWGFVIAIILDFVLLATTKSFSGQPYLYPLLPFNWSALRTLIFRTSVQNKQNVNKH
ncbi:MAG: spore germination protein [Niameybacter sp.]|uniref:spore germination protein n=1 Tax=Niameybacter sp. TaxID=2033640 RepID=UPI002FCA0DF2